MSSVKAILYGQNYTKQETDGLLAAKANASEVATALNAKANASEVATALNTKANTSDITRIDGLLETKADIDEVNDALGDINDTLGNKVDTDDVVKIWPTSNLSTNENPVSVKAVYSAIQNLSPSGGGSSITVDTELNENSDNPVTNSVITTTLNGKAPTNHASSSDAYGKGTNTNYGHVKLFDDVNSSYGASSGIATTPKALYDLSTSFTSSLNTKQDKLTNNDPLETSQGGTGTSSFTINSVILANSSTTSGALQSVRSSAGALYSTGQDIKPQFGTLPLEYGGTGYTDSQRPGFFIAGYKNLITNGDFMSVHDWDSSANIPTGWTRTGTLTVTDQITNYRRIILTNNAYGSNYAQMQWVTNELVSNNANKYITFSVKYGATAIRTMTAQVNSDGTAINNNNINFDDETNGVHLFITPKDGYITFTIRLESTQQSLVVYAVKGEFAVRQTFQDLYGNLMGSPVPVSSGGTGVSSLPFFGDFLGTDETGRIISTRPDLLDLDNPPYTGIFNISSSETIIGTKPLPNSTTHTGICLVFFYTAGTAAALRSNWTEIYIVTRTGSASNGSASNRAWRRSFYNNGTTSNITEWVEIPYDLASITSALSNKEPAFTTLSVSKGGTGASSFSGSAVIMSNSTGTALETRTLTNNTSNAAITASTAIPTLNTIYYGLPNINGTAYNRSTTIYVPTTAGTSGQILVSSGSGAPTWDSLPSASTSTAGIVKLSSATNSASTSVAATASAVKSAYDLANSKAAASHSHAASDINSGTLGVARGGTGSNSFTANSLVISNTSTTGGLITLSNAADGSALISKGTTTLPAWQSISPSVSITGGTSSAAPKINISVLGKSGTAQSITTASTSAYGVTKLSSAINSTSNELAATAGAVKTAYDLANSVSTALTGWGSKSFSAKTSVTINISTYPAYFLVITSTNDSAGSVNYWHVAKIGNTTGNYMASQPNVSASFATANKITLNFNGVGTNGWVLGNSNAFTLS